MEDINEFKQILSELKRIKKEEKMNKLDDNMLFDSAVRIYNSININRMTKNKMKKPVDINVPASDKQKKLLEELKYEGDMNITKADARRIIQERLERRRTPAI